MYLPTRLGREEEARPMQLDPRFVKLAHDPGDPVLCSHCPFCGSGQITGRSDGGIDCAFCGQSFIVRVQPAFPGMPQAPGMGAPTDVGPDMGAMPPPGMEEGGLPPGAGGPPGAEGEDEGPPFGDEGEEEGGPPGEEAEEEGGAEDEAEGPPPFPPKKKAAQAAARTAAMSHEDMSSAQLREHMRDEHGYHHVPDDPDWLVEQTHLDDHADDPWHNHHHPDLESEQADFHSGDRDWLGGHGITGRRATAGLRADTPENRGHYRRGWNSSERTFLSGSDSSPLERADSKGEPPAWYDGYMDSATGRPKWHSLTCPSGEHETSPECTLNQPRTARWYRTLAGDELPEPDYIRHLAILHSGMSPLVIRLVRREHAAS
jgi:hypothetical protein